MNNLFKNICLVLSVLAVSAIAAYAVLAWTEPGSPAPNGNVAAPINVGTNTQTKSGGLNITGNVGIGTASPGGRLDVEGGKLCLNGQCCTSWNDCITQFGPGSACKAVGIACSSNSDCCSSVCTSGVCASGASGSCGVVGATCTSNSNCCSSDCNSGACVVLPCTNGACPSGYVCKDGNNCCRASQCGYDVFPNGQCVDDGGTRSQGPLTTNFNLICRNGVWKTIACSWGCDYFGCDSGTCQNHVCAGSSCSGGTCKGSLAPCSANSECCSGTCLSGSCTVFFPCSGAALPAGAKRIFVTGSLYPGNLLTSDAAADNLCQDAAFSGGLSKKSSTNGANDATFKALVYLGGVDPKTKITTGESFWNGMKSSDGTTYDKSGSTCKWNPIALNSSDFFTDDGGGNYIQNPINYDQTGAAANVTTWTNMSQTGSLLSTTTVNMNTSRCSGCCSYGPGYSDAWVKSCLVSRDTYYFGEDGVHAVSWYGNSSSKTSSWTYKSWDNIAQGDAGGCSKETAVTNCTTNTSRALYCIEQ